MEIRQRRNVHNYKTSPWNVSFVQFTLILKYAHNCTSKSFFQPNTLHEHADWHWAEVWIKYPPKLFVGTRHLMLFSRRVYTHCILQTNTREWELKFVNKKCVELYIPCIGDKWRWGILINHRLCSPACRGIVWWADVI